MELFDIIKNIFISKNHVWKKVAQIDKSRNFFMINRLMSIQFPIQANQFNHLKISPSPVIDWWHNTLSNRYSKVPSWVYTKTQKNAKKDTKSPACSEETENFIRDKFQLSKRDLTVLKEFYPDKYHKWIKDVSEQLGLENNKKIP